MNDLLNKIFLRLILHAAVSVATHLLWLFIARDVGWDNPLDTLWILLFITNCTALILGKLSRILERLPEK